METNNHFPNSLRRIRMDLGMRQVDVAKMLGHASPDRISHWEKGVALPGLVNLFKLSVIYGVSAENLYRELYDSIRDQKYENGLNAGFETGSGSNPSGVPTMA